MIASSPSSPAPARANTMQTLVGLGVVLVGLAMAFGAIGISSDAGYGGVGPNFLPWLVSIGLVVCGAWITWEARTGGFRSMPDGDAEPANWPGLVWLSAGLLLNAALIEHLGFILSCGLCYLLAVQGLRRAAGQPAANAPRTWAVDFGTGLVIAAPVYWMFTQFLAINLPGLTSTGWI
ncbi:tripartite tricarboxylate transporter TctB family protein [Pseudacidovorax intermedius]|uniref:Tripartite tricarboxylate transporter TctB n=1 Tax=Pseudacidovorax intermedius TaxID=433924 RepID=A0A147GP79_9BURK|nr:tripartite tricarboxylate transporter TctB family protein [Pseudacidovorax intermedius]KTT15695.1 tripartite tricarboxylate transporter TctB [Pseudacidovorax intermedius]